MKYLSPEALHSLWQGLPDAQRTQFVRSLDPQARAALVAFDPTATAPDDLPARDLVAEYIARVYPLGEKK